ncbi:NapC/NirT family cytochrome c [Thermodesulforhabdus norvegica]|uniref:Cytochrome c-type protein n=1 Tax=Thermodesulforhabdus norvegica TaxID=39841 RepID=A0A1I4S399_9BACT|nr:NapC/NirT family cytochrome c [Thermodesulforhabdus norvegica]SFM58968.1 trimethylamine-N-oxide reductase (cytochrome c), cytochrome c-type subunit TorC [Thermodesulforhabdus norvegica]
MSRKVKAMLLVALGIFLGFPLFSMTYYTMVRTSTPGFCASCHEIQPAYNAWKTSTHVNNGQGVVADCMDCHLPAPHDTVEFFYAKTLHGAKDIFVHFVKGSDSYSREKSRNRAYETIKNDQCLKCHRNILYMPHKRGAMLAHRSVIYPRKGYEKKCFDCHKNLVHLDRSQFVYRF